AWDIEARYEDGRIVMTVPAEVVASSTYPAVLDPVVSGELFSDTPVNGTTGANSAQVRIASDGTQYFLVWPYLRDDLPGDIFGTRLTSDGAVVDPLNIRINAAAGAQQHPAVAFVGTGYVVAWEHVAAAGNTDIAAAFVAADGSVTQLGMVVASAANETH